MAQFLCAHLESEHSGIRVLEHDGAIPGSFYSHLLVVPEYDLGQCCAYNRYWGDSRGFTTRW